MPSEFINFPNLVCWECNRQKYNLHLHFTTNKCKHFQKLCWFLICIKLINYWLGLYNICDDWAPFEYWGGEKSEEKLNRQDSIHLSQKICKMQKEKFNIINTYAQHRDPCLIHVHIKDFAVLLIFTVCPYKEIILQILRLWWREDILPNLLSMRALATL